MPRVILSFLISNIGFLFSIICIQQLSGLSISNQPLPLLSEWWMMWPYHIPFSWLPMACRSFQKYLMNIAWYALFYYPAPPSQFQWPIKNNVSNSQPCAPDLCGQLCISMHRWILLHNCHWHRFVLSTDCSFYDLYDITHLNFVVKLWYKFSFYILTSQLQA